MGLNFKDIKGKLNPQVPDFSKRLDINEEKEKGKNRITNDPINCFNMSSCEENYIFDLKNTNKGPTTIKEPDWEGQNIVLSDDFYSNIMDWSGNYVFYSNGSSFFQLDIETKKRIKISSFKRMITSVKTLDSENIILGFITGVLKLYNINEEQCYDLPEHASRISTIDIFNHQIFTGSRDKTVRFFDIRTSEIGEINKHQQEVTGVKINRRGDMLASGGNDNKIFVYDRRTDKVLFENKHKAAVRAIAWSKFNLLATGGGTACRKIKLWNMSSLKKLNEVSFNSQICNLYWTKDNQIISTHGYSQNDVKVSDMELRLQKVYQGHRNRVMHFAINESEDKFITGSADNTLKFWKL